MVCIHSLSATINTCGVIYVWEQSYQLDSVNEQVNDVNWSHYIRHGHLDQIFWLDYSFRSSFIRTNITGFGNSTCLGRCYTRHKDQIGRPSPSFGVWSLTTSFWRTPGTTGQPAQLHDDQQKWLPDEKSWGMKVASLCTLPQGDVTFNELEMMVIRSLNAKERLYFESVEARSDPGPVQRFRSNNLRCSTKGRYTGSCRWFTSTVQFYGSIRKKGKKRNSW